MAFIKNITKAGLFSIDEFCFFYGRQLKLSSVKHERVMEALEYGKEHNLINYSILEFIASQNGMRLNILDPLEKLQVIKIVNYYNGSTQVIKKHRRR